MKANPRYLDHLNDTLGQICRPGSIRVADAEYYDGASPFSVRPTLVCEIEAEPLTISPAELHQRIRRRFGEGFELLPEPETSARSSSGQIAEAAGRLGAAILSRVLGIEFGSGIYFDDDGRVKCWLEYLSRPAAQQAFGAALAALAEAASGSEAEPSASEGLLARLERMFGRQRPVPDSLLLIRAARARDIPFLPMADDPVMWQFGWGRRSRQFWVTGSNEDGLVSLKVSRDKAAAKRLFHELEIPTPDWRLVHPGEDAGAAAAEIGWPCVVKPVNGNSGKGVTAGITRVAEVKQAAARARSFSPVIIVEAHEPGEDHRLTVVDGQLVAADQRRPPYVTGDGRSTISELVSALNHSVRSASGSGRHLKPVVEDASMDASLASQGLRRDSVLPDGQPARLRTNANQSTGGTVEDFTHRVHPQVKALAEHLAAAFDLRTCGLDYITEDIGRSPEEGGGAFIEMNATPSINGMRAAGIDEVEIASLILGDVPGRIAATLLLAPEADHPEIAARLASALADRKDGGLATMDQGRIGTLSLQARRGPHRLVEALLRYPTLGSLQILWSREALQDFGVPLDRLDKAVILGPPPTVSWLSLLHRLSGNVMHVDTTEEAVEAVLRL